VIAPLVQERWRARATRSFIELPRGVADTPGRPVSLERLDGVVAGDRRAVASAFDLRDREGRLIVAASASLGFEVTLDDGRTVVVPAGRLRSIRGSATVEEASLPVFLNEPEPLPRARVYAWSIRGGEPVVLHAEWDERPPDEDRGYRQAPIATLQPRGVVWLARP
jgi:hypothetical protein